MTDYTKTTNFAAKDNLVSGNPAKVVKGSEIDTEYNNIAVAIATKSNIASPTFTGTATIPTVDINAGNIDGTIIGASSAAAGTFTSVTTSGNVTVGGNLTVTGNAVISGNLTFGDADTDNISFAADVNSNILPNIDDTYDLGSSTKEWRNLYIDGTANIDSLVADTADINGGTLDGVVIGGSSAAAGTFTTATATTGNITTVNATTVDSTNVEVTNLKAKDGTASATIADVTGVMTVASAVLTTADINGGTADAVVIGGATPAAGSFTTISASGTITGPSGTWDAGGVDIATGDTYAINSVDVLSATTLGSSVVNSSLTSLGTITSLVATTADINGGTIDGAVIGGASAAAITGTTGQFNTSLNVDGTITADGLTVDTNTLYVDSTNNRVGIGTTSPSSVLHLSTSNDPKITLTDTGFGASADITGSNGNLRLNSQTATIFDMAGSEVARIDSSGRVGIGTSSPSAPLDIVSSATGGTTVELDNTSTGGRNWILYSSGSGNSFGAGKLAFYDADAAQVRLIVDTSGNVGIGTTSPTSTLTVSGSANVTGNVTLGDASTDTVTVNGYMGVGIAPSGIYGLYISHSGFTGVTQYGLRSSVEASSIATTGVRAGYFRPATAAASFTTADAVAVYSANAGKGAGSTITNQHGVYIEDQTQGTNNYGITSLVSSGTNKWNIYASGTANNYFAGSVGIGTSSPAANLVSAGSSSTNFKALILRNGDGTTGSSASIDFEASSGTQGDEAAMSGRIAGVRTGAGTSGALTFSTTNAGVLAERLRITSSGNVGIGTTTVTESLDANGNIKLRASAAARYVYSAVGDSTTVDAGHKYDPVSDYVATLTGGSERMRVDSSGNVGIGTSSPSGLFSLAKGSRTLDIKLEDTAATGDVGVQLRAGSGDFLGFAAGGGTGIGIVLDSSNNVGIGTTSPVSLGAGYKNLDIRHTTGGGITLGDTSNIHGYLFSDSNGLTLQASGARTLEFMTGSTERMRIDSSGNVGIGTTSPSGLLHIQRSNAGNFLFMNDNVACGMTVLSSSSDLIFKHQSSIGQFVFQNSTGTDRLRIDSSGNVGIGVTPSAWYSGNKVIDIGTRSALWSGGAGQPNLGHNCYVNTAGNFIYKETAAANYYTQDAGHKWYNAGSGTAGTAITFTQAMTLDASGNLLVGKTATGLNTVGIELRADNSAYFTKDSAVPIYANRKTSDGSIIEFRKDNTTVGSISVTASATAYNTSSDQRLKENIVDAPSASDDIDAIQVRSFDWKVDGSHQKYGMVAQELVTVAPEAISQPDDPEDMMGVDYSKLVPMLVKEIQSLRARVAQLEGSQ